jgi:DNA-binding cell septation regulator SpoVG
MNVEVVAIRPLTNSGDLRAFVSIKIDNITTHDLRIVQQPGQRVWISMPTREYRQHEQRRFSPVVELSESPKYEVSRIVLAAWQGGQR